MNKKFWIAVISIFIFANSLIANDCDFFSFYKTSNIDFYNGKSFLPESIEEVANDVNSITRILIKTKSDKTTREIIYNYSNGKIKSIYSENRDGRNTIFQYPPNGYFESFDYQKRKYPEENTCLLYEDDRLIYRIKIDTNKPEYKKIIFERPSKDVESFYLYETVEYFYKDKLIQKYIATSYNQKGNIYRYDIHTFNYDEEKLISYTVELQNEIRWKYDINYNSKNQINEIQVTDYKFPANNKRIIYEDFDAKGNWIKCKEYYNNKLEYDIERIIQYSE